MAKAIMKGQPSGQPQLNEIFMGCVPATPEPAQNPEWGERRCVTSSARDFDSAGRAAGSR
jgi:hypothetical protein